MDDDTSLNAANPGLSGFDTAGGVGKLSDLANIMPTDPTTLALAGFTAGPDGTVTRTQLKDAGIAKQQNSGFMDTAMGMLPYGVMAGMGAGAAGLFDGVAGFGAGAAGGGDGAFLGAFEDLAPGAAAGAGAADAAGLAQMGMDAGLTGSELSSFTAGGGTAGSTAAGGGGIGTGAAAPFGASGGATPTTTPQLSNNPISGGPEAPPDPSKLPPQNPSLPQTPPTPTPQSKPGATDPSFIQKAINSVTKDPMKLGALGLNAYSQFNANKNGKSAQDQLMALSQPARGASEQLINEGLSGNVPAPIMQQFQTSFNNAKSAIEGRYANMGRDPNNDSSAQAEIKAAKDQMDAQVANYASQLLSQGLSAAGVAAGPATASINAGVAQDKELSSSMAQALQQMAMLQAMQQGKTAPP